MQIIELVKSANKKYMVKAQRLMELKRYYLGMYRFYMMRLYDRGYIDDPTRFSQRQIFRNVSDMNIRGMLDVSGSVSLSTEQVRYALAYHKNDSEIVEFLTILLNVLKYRGYSKDIDAVYDTFCFNEASRQKMNVGLKMFGARVHCNDGYCTSKAVLSCLIKPDEEIGVYSFEDKLWEVAMSELEIPSSEWYLDGLFSSRLSNKEEIENIRLILDGLVELDGKYSEKLREWLGSHKWSSVGRFSEKQGLYSYLFVSCTERVFPIESGMLNELIDRGMNVIALEDHTFFVRKPKESIKLPMGCFAVEGDLSDDSLMFDGNILNGYTGEAYTIDSLEEHCVDYVGCPIELNRGYKDKELYCDLEQCSLICDSWFKYSNAEWVYDDDVEEVVCSKFIEGSLEYKLLEAYNKSLRGLYILELPFDFTMAELETAKKNIMKCL